MVEEFRVKCTTEERFQSNITAPHPSSLMFDFTFTESSVSFCPPGTSPIRSDSSPEHSSPSPGSSPEHRPTYHTSLNAFLVDPPDINAISSFNNCNPCISTYFQGFATDNTENTPHVDPQPTQYEYNNNNTETIPITTNFPTNNDIPAPTDINFTLPTSAEDIDKLDFATLSQILGVTEDTGNNLDLGSW